MRRYYVLVFILSSIFVRGYAQQKYMSEKDESFTNYIDSAKFFEKINPSRSFDYVEKALTQSLKSRDKKGEAISYQSLGRINYNLNQFDLAIDYYQKALSLFESLGIDNQEGTTHQLLGDAYFGIFDYKNSLNSYNKSLKFAENDNNTNEIVKLKVKIADVYSQTGENQKALDVLNEVLKTEQKRKNSQGIISTQNKIGFIYQETNKEEKAIEVYDKSAEMASEIGDRKAVSNSLRSKSSALRQSKRYDEELLVRKQLLDMTVDENEATGQAEENLEIGNIYIQKNEAEKAIPYIQKSIELSEGTGNLEKKGEALQTLSNAYGKQFDYNKALTAYEQYVQTMDDIYKKRESEIVSAMKIATTLNRKLERLDLIEKDLRLSQKTVDLLRQEQLVNMRELKAQRILTYSLFGALIILSIASFFVLRSMNMKRKANQMLALRSLRSQMNPHFIYNSLNSVNNFISKNDERSANKYLSDFSRLMRSVMENSKHDFVLLSSETEILRLYLTLEHSRFNDKFDYTLEVEEGLENKGFMVPPMLIQPFIENAIWHGLRYKEVRGMLNVNLREDDTNIIVTVEDDGIGRKKSMELKTKFQKEHNSTGMMNIENRIGIINRLFDSKIEINIEDLDKEKEEGTRVVIKIPGRVEENGGE